MSKSTGRFFQNFEALLKNRTVSNWLARVLNIIRHVFSGHMGTFSEKATEIWENPLVELTLREGHKIWKKSPTCFDIYSVTSKQVGDFFIFCGLFRKPAHSMKFKSSKILSNFCGLLRIYELYTVQCGSK